MNAGSGELPMVPGGCTLNESSLVDQLDRYRRLGRMALGLEERERGLVITFRAEIDLDLLRETVTIERACCSFFTVDYDASERRLSIATDDPAPVDALRALLAALRATAPSSAAP
jgi:hypothetical protein